MRVRHFIQLIITLCLSYFSCIAQQTVGLISYNPDLSSAGYNLIFPHNQSNVFLLNECGQIVHQWMDEPGFNPGNSAYILENGNLVKCKRKSTSAVNDPIWAGGGGETVEIRTWENELLASFTLNDSLFRLHHDVAPLPNGNVLMISWELKTKEEAIKAGRTPENLDQDKLWPEAILEWNPESDSIVWEWHVWDHLIQDFDSSQDNFGVVADHPELVNINYDETGGHPDWLHINAIDYNPILDQIVLSVPDFNEIWIIDHSTTTEEAKGHSGGNAGKGGDLLFRWGNPQTYNRGNAEDQQLYFQHDINWIDSNADSQDSDFGKLILYNNRVPPNISTINVIQPNIIGFNYQMDNSVFSPSGFESTFIHPDQINIAFSNSLSSAQMLPNGNVLALAGRWGFAYELTPSNDIAWEYRVPLKAGSPVIQGDTLSINNNITFRMERYPVDFPAFVDKDLSPLNYLEMEPNTNFCNQIVDAESLTTVKDMVKVFPNPASNFIVVEINNQTLLGKPLNLMDLNGKVVLEQKIKQERSELLVNDLAAGIYFLRLGHQTIDKITIGN